jgi:hypothetical protein
MNYSRPAIASALLIALTSTAALAAGLKDKPPEGVKLAGTQWQLDPYNSDDGGEAIDRAARKAEPSTSRSTNGGIFGDEDSAGARFPGDPNRGFPSDRDRPGRWPSPSPAPDSSRTGAEIDPTGGGGAVAMQWGGRRSSIFFESLRSNPKKLTFSEGNQSVTVSADGVDTECEAGVKAPFSDSYGDGERSCGWNGRAWVVETKRGRQFTRTDRYELSKDGKTLRYTTAASEEGIGRVRIERKYQIPVAVAK